MKLSNNNIVEVVEEIVMSVTNFTKIKGLNIIFNTYILVKSIVELHGGHVDVKSEFGKASKFTVVIPIGKVIRENVLVSSTIRNKSENIQVEFSDIYSSSET